MRILPAAFLFAFCLAISPRAEAHLDYWSWSTNQDGTLVGEVLTWTLPDLLYAALPQTDPLTSKESFLSDAARKAAEAYVKERAPAYGPTGGDFQASAYKIVAFGYREVPPNSVVISLGEHTGKWLRYVEYGAGVGSLPVKVYLLPNDTVLRPKIEPVKAQP